MSEAPQNTPPQGATQTLHASCVAFQAVSGWRGVLLLGPSGAGKSGLALQLMAVGARLVADDRVIVQATTAGLEATAPAAIRGMIEARGIGLLAAEALACAPLCLAIDLGRKELSRMPPEREMTILGNRIPLFHTVESAHYPAAVKQYILAGKAQA